MSSTKGVVNIRGKEYRTVALRVAMFRAEWPAHEGWAIQTTILSDTESVITVRAEVYNHKGTLIATGHASEDRAQGNVNRTSALENAETGAVGRALFFVGLTPEDLSVASAEDVERWQRSQGAQDAKPSPTPQTATNGPECIEAAKKNPPDLILLDVMMPEMSGFEVLKELKMAPPTDKIPVIMLTVLSEREMLEEARESGVVDYAIKSHGFGDLIDKVRRVFQSLENPA